MKRRKLKLTIGSDPEMMLLNSKTGDIVSSLPVLRQNKSDPIQLGDGIKMYADNVLVESAFPHVTSCDEWIHRLKDVLFRMQSRIGDSFLLLAKAAHVYRDLSPKPDDELVIRWLEDKTGEIKIPEDWQVGCNPNYDAYLKLGENIRKQRPFQNGLRTGSFHIHIGNANYQDDGEETLLTPQSKYDAVRLMDVFVGCASVIFDKDETAPIRKAIYGKAGEYRPTPYGIEYRTLGNYALRSPELAGLIFDLSLAAMSKMEDQEETDFVLEFSKNAQTAINNNDKHLAHSICSTFLPNKLLKRVVNAPKVDEMYRAWAF